MPWSPDPAAVRAGFVRAYTAAVLASHWEPTDATVRALTWPAARDAAIASDDDHVIKLVHALIEERAVYGDGARLAAAARAVG